MNPNIIDSVVLTPEAVAAWQETSGKAVAALRAQGITLRPEEIGTEEAFSQEDGSLLIQCRAGQFLVNLLIPREQWSMAN